jgi:hypothetical protein
MSSGEFSSGASVSEFWKEFYETGTVNLAKAQRDAPWLLGASKSLGASIAVAQTSDVECKRNGAGETSAPS